MGKLGGDASCDTPREVTDGADSAAGRLKPRLTAALERGESCEQHITGTRVQSRHCTQEVS